MTPIELRELRDARHLTQAKLAELLGVHTETVSRWERGERKIPYMVALALEALDHDPNAD